MKAVRALVIALPLLAAGFACERWPTGVSEPPAAARDSSSSQVAPRPAFDRRIGNYAVAW